MSSAALQHLATLSWVTTFSACFIALVRAPVRGTLGARAAYWLWLAVPASAMGLAAPRPAHSPSDAAGVAPGAFGWMWARLDALVPTIHVSGPLAGVALVLWLTGAAAILVLAVLRQRAFVRSLGGLAALPDGTWRSRGVTEPMLLGALRPRVLVPWDFEQRYTAEEREFVLAHERAHMRRGDTLVNALGVAWLAVFWFNPVMFWAMYLLRFDQDLACDASVLASASKARRGRYAGALLKAQLAGEAALPLPFACHWRSVHPLRRRIGALRRPVAGRWRHRTGVLLAAILVACASLAARAVQPPAQMPRPVASPVTAGAVSAARLHASGKVCPLTRRSPPARQSMRRRS